MSKLSNLILFVMSTFLLLNCANYEVGRHKEYVAQAKHYNTVGNYDESLNYLNLIEKNVPLKEELIGLKADNFFKKGEETKALLILEETLADRPFSPFLNFRLGFYLYEMNRKVEAKDVLEKVVRRTPNAVGPRKLLGKTLIALKLYDDAAKILIPATGVNQKDDEFSFLAAFSLFKLNKYSESIRHFSHCYTIGFQRDRSAQYLAFMHTHAGETATANLYIRHLLLKNPKDKFGRKMQVKNLLNIKGTDPASLLSVLSADQPDDWSQYEFYRSLNELKLDEQSREYLSGLWQANPEKTWVALNLAQVLYKEGEIKMALRVLEKSADKVEPQYKDTILAYASKLNENNSSMLAVAPSQDNNLVLAENSRDIASEEVANFTSYIVKKGETLQLISQKLFGTSKFWRAIKKVNPKINESNLKEGTELKVPVKP